jgi:ABC-type transporter Mla MlaB component
VPLARARLQADRRHLASGAGAAVNGSHRFVAGQLLVRWEHRPDTLTLWLSGTLDRATSALLDRELNERAIATMRLFVDVTGLEFIDPRGMESLVRIHRRANERGDRLSFRHGPHVAQRPLGLIRAVQLRSEWATRPAGVRDEDSYFALAMACADVDHPRPGDRPRAA